MYSETPPCDLLVPMTIYFEMVSHFLSENPDNPTTSLLRPTTTFSVPNLYFLYKFTPLKRPLEIPDNLNDKNKITKKRSKLYFETVFGLSFKFISLSFFMLPFSTGSLLRLISLTRISVHPVTAPFNNMRNLKFKSSSTVAFFPAVNHN